VTKTGGSGGGTIRFKSELDHGGNAGLANTAVKWLEPIHAKYDGLTYGDLYTLAGVTAIKEMGGPTIGWSSGRVDADEITVTPDGRLPNADSGPPLADKSDADHLRTVFNRMGFNDQEIVILSGAHAIGRCHENASGYSGPWTPTPTTFNNAYYTLLTSLKWIPKDWSGPPQYVDGSTGKLMMLPTDLVLLQDKSFMKWVGKIGVLSFPPVLYCLVLFVDALLICRACFLLNRTPDALIALQVDVYAKDGNRFEKDFSKAFQKLEELGTSNLTPTEWA